MTFCLTRLVQRLFVGNLLVLGLSGNVAQADLAVHPEPTSTFDLKISGGLTGQPADEARYVSWEELNRLPTQELELDGEFVPGRQMVRVVFIDQLWAALPVAKTADTLLAYCADDYFSIYSSDFIAKQRPFLVLAINGNGPEKWPPEGLTFNPGPYVISVAEEVVPGSKSILDVGHKRPWGVNEINFVNGDRVLAPAFADKWSELSPLGEKGRTIWVNSCSSCHTGPGGLVGGNKSQRPFEVLAAHARYNESYFRQYVRDPKSLVPSAKMEPHPHYTDPQMDALVAFITADGK